MNRLFFFVTLFLCLSVFKGYANTQQKVVSLAPNLTEIVYAIGEEKKLVGNTLQCDYPEAAKSVFKVGNYASPSVELIVKSGANTVLATEGNSIAIVERLKSLKFNVVTVNPSRVSELPGAVRTIANALNAKERGELVAGDIEKALNSQTKKTPHSFLLVLSFDPIYSASPDTWIGELFERAGYKNIVKAKTPKYPALSKEAILANPPDIVFVTPTSLDSKTPKPDTEILRKKVFGDAAPGNKKTKFEILPPDILERPGPRVIEGIRYLQALGEPVKR